MTTKTEQTKIIQSTTKIGAVDVIVQLNKTQLVNLLFSVKGVTFIGANTTTIPRMNKGGRKCLNYMFDNVVKDSTIHCMLGFDYEIRRDTVNAAKWVEDAVNAALDVGIDQKTIDSSIKTLKEYSTQSIEKFVAKKRGWGKHMINPYTGKVSRIMIDHIKKDKKTGQLLPETYARYMMVEILGAKTPVYRYKDTGEVLSEKDLATVKKYLIPSQPDDIVIRSYSIENIKNIRINKNSYRIRG